MRMLSLFSFWSLVFVGTCFATGDASPPVVKVELTFQEIGRTERDSIVLSYTFLGGKRKISSIEVVRSGKSVTIPSDEIDGIEDVQLDSIALRLGTASNGRVYHYVDALFGPPRKEAVNGYQRVWFLIENGEYRERETFLDVQTGPGRSHFKQLTEKPKGQPVKDSLEP